MDRLKLPILLFTPTLLQLEERSVIKPDGVIEDIPMSLDSWEHPMDFMILTPKNDLGGHSIILGRPWLATADAFISCGSVICTSLMVVQPRNLPCILQQKQLQN